MSTLSLASNQFPYPQLTILFHLNQCGLDIKVDHQKISEYVNNFSKNYIKSSNLDLSKKEIKFLEKNLRSLEEKYNYVI